MNEAKKPSEKSLQKAAQCWCDEETSSIEMDIRLATAFAKRLDEAAERYEAEMQRLVEALKFYADKENWTITEDYEGYVVEGFIIGSDIENPPKTPNTWNGYGWGGKLARQALEQHKKWDRGE